MYKSRIESGLINIVVYIDGDMPPTPSLQYDRRVAYIPAKNIYILYKLSSSNYIFYTEREYYFYVL